MRRFGPSQYAMTLAAAASVLSVGSISQELFIG